METTRSTIHFAGLTFRGLDVSDILPSGDDLKLVVTVNADFVVTSVRSARFRRIISDNYSTFDGQVTWWLAKLLGRPRGVAAAKISGASVIHDLLSFARERAWNAFFLGARSSVNEASVAIAKNKYGIEVRGYSPPFSDYPMSNTWNADVIDRILEFRPKLLFVALGSPKQEYWLDDHRETLKRAGVALAMGCGGTLDFLSGSLRRAPTWMQSAGLEGVYRLAIEPKWFRVRRLGRSALVIPIALWYAMLDLAKIREQ